MSPKNKKKLNLLRKKLDKIDNNLFKNYTQKNKNCKKSFDFKIIQKRNN